MEENMFLNWALLAHVNYAKFFCETHIPFRK